MGDHNFGAEIQSRYEIQKALTAPDRDIWSRQRNRVLLTTMCNTGTSMALLSGEGEIRPPTVSSRDRSKCGEEYSSKFAIR